MEMAKKEFTLFINHVKRIPTLCVGVTLLGLFLVGCSAQGSSAVPVQSGAVNSESPQLASGQAIYEANCAECHGPDGEGQPNWQRPGPDGLFPAPPHDSSGHTWHHPDSQLLQIIAQGGSTPNSTMPAYQDSLSEEEMEAVLAYIKTFWGASEQKYQEQVSKQSSTQ